MRRYIWKVLKQCLVHDKWQKLRWNWNRPLYGERHQHLASQHLAFVTKSYKVTVVSIMAYTNYPFCKYRIRFT